MSEVEKLKHQERESMATKSFRGLGSGESMSQLHVPMPPVLYQQLKTAVRVLGFVSLAEWARDMARSAVRQADLIRSKDTIELKSGEQKSARQ